MKRHHLLLKVSVAAAALSAGLAGAALASDLPVPTTKAPAAPAAEAPWSPQLFVKLGVTYGINNGSAKSYAAFAPGGPLNFLPGVNASASNVVTLGGEVGIFVLPNVSIQVSGGIPQWVTVKTSGAITGVTPPSGTHISSDLPGFIPVTASYHFTNFGAFQPYIGAGLTPIFSFTTRDYFDTGVRAGSSVGVVLQAGADFMIDKHWGLTFDVKRIWASREATSTGVATYPGVPLAGKLDTQVDPWLLSTGLTYRF